MPGPVERWLETFMCKQYADTFEAYGFKTLQSVCQLQHPQLQAMGVAQEHVDKILESVHVLRQSMFGGMNHYKDEGYGSQSNVRMQHAGYIQAPQAHNVSGMNPNYNMPQVGYNNNNNQGNIMASHRGHMMDSIYQQQQPQPQQYPPSPYQNQGPYHMGQYNQQNSTYGPMMNYNNNQNRTQVRQPTTATSHVHSRHQNPQEVANNILQMAASYQPSQTVQVPLSKHRQAPYHVPVSAHYNMPNHVNNTEQMNRQFNYPNPSQHNTHAARTSPVSPGSMYMHSPASQHSSQSLPNSSPRSIHSPSGCGNIRSPVPSPAGSMRSPCHMQSPVNTPINQQLHVTTGQQMVQSPPQHQMGFSPKNNPLSPQGIQSPLYKQQNQKNYLNENVAATNFTANNPLQSLQKLCMLPDRQVVDPKSIVNDSSPSPNQTQKSVSSDVDWNTTTISETASVNNCTDGKNCDEIDNNSGIQTNLCTSSENSCSAQKTAINTVVDSYADDAVKKSAENTIKTDVDFEHQKLKYLGQPCNTESGSDKQPPLECVQGTNCEFSERVQITKCKPFENVLETHKKSETTGNSINNLQASIETKEVSDTSLVSEQIDGIPESTDHIDCVPKSSDTLLNSELTDNLHNELKIQENSVCENESNRLEQTVEKSHDSEQKSCDNKDSIERLQDNQVLRLESESVENICDKSIVNGCDNTHCDDQSKPDISSDCRKDEVKSMVNGIDDSEDNSSDVDMNKADLFIKSEPNIEILEMDSDSLLNHKTEQRHKNEEKADNKRILREIPPRVASASPFYVDDSDSGDEGILMVRKDVKYTYSRYSKIHRDINSHVSVSDNDTFDISDEESLDRNSLDSDMSKGFDCDLIQSLPKTVNGPGSNPGHRKKNTVSKPFKNRCSRNVISDTPGQGSKDKSENQKGNGRSKRRRTATSKYGDEMYLGDDFALDSEEETKIERKSKRKRKISGDTTCIKAKVKSEDVNLDSDDVGENDKKCKKKEKIETKFNCNIKSEEIILDSDEEEETGKIDQSKQKFSVDQKLPNKSKIEHDILVSDEELEVEKTAKRKSKISDDLKSKVQIKEENEDSQMDSLDSKEICIDIIDSSDNLGDGSDIITFKPITKLSSSFLPVASTSKSQCENKPLVQKGKPRTKSKLKVSKAGKSKSRGKLLDDSVKNMKLKKTMNLMKQKGKKKPEVPVKEIGPILRIKDSQTPKERCLVVNQQIEENSDKTAKNKRSTVRVSTVQVSKLPSEKSVHVPASLAGENTSWVCALCKKHSSYKFLGDLFGPYYTEGNLPEDEGSSSMDKKGKQKRQSVSVDSKSNSKGRRKSKDSTKPNEIWVHEDCAAWADGVLLIGAKMYGLQEATDIASSTVCTYCKETGAMVGCLHKGCSQKFHYYCGIESGCYLDEENYSLLCPKHRDKRLKSAEAKSFKT